MSTPSIDTPEQLTLESANVIVDAALAAARRSGLQPMTVVALDAGGHVVCCKREDGSGILRFEIAFGKAWGALGMGRSSRDLEQMSIQRPVFVTTLASAAAGRLVPVAGGVLVVSANRVVGAIGVSGDTSDADERCAIEGIGVAGYDSIPAAAAPSAR